MSMRVGIIGCGNIAPQYGKGLAMFPQDVSLAACADLIPEKAAQFARAQGIEAVSLDSLLRDESIEIIVNLTLPASHAEVGLQVIEAGKHLYSEKPLAMNRADARRILDAAKEKNVRVGCAPDTFLGSSGQTSRKVIDEGGIGRPVAAVAFLAIHGHEGWHPNPAFYYQPGGGPMLDMGTYYLTALVNLLGPIRRIAAMTSRGFDERIARHQSIKGQRILVEVDTHMMGTAEFESGAVASIVTSFDIWQHHLPHIEIYGTHGTLSVPDPNNFGGGVSVWMADNSSRWQAVPPLPGADYLRGAGVAEMARAIRANQPHRASGELAFHVLDAMLAFEESSAENRFVDLSSHVTRPAAWIT